MRRPNAVSKFTLQGGQTTQDTKKNVRIYIYPSANGTGLKEVWKKQDAYNTKDGYVLISRLDLREY